MSAEVGGAGGGSGWPRSMAVAGGAGPGCSDVATTGGAAGVAASTLGIGGLGGSIFTGAVLGGSTFAGSAAGSIFASILVAASGAVRAMSADVGGAGGGSGAPRSMVAGAGCALAAALRRSIACCRAAKTSLVGSPVSRAPMLR